jgi:asparagine synthase (glutamine-hydrolysing)
MGQAVAHRGPDGERIVREGPVGLAFRRLALVDPDGGEQPLTNADGSIMLIANGEIYNHRELERGLPSGTRMRTSSDCEVLVGLYERDGLRFLDAVLGMYAIILWDRRRNRLLFARDRFGIKPLYYTRNGDSLTFASEIKALFQDPRCPRSLDWEAALADQALHAAPYLVHAPVTSWFRGVEVVPAGTIVTFDLTTGRSERHVYWKLPSFDGDGDASDAELLGRYRELLAASVADCATADAEVGLFLSGGVDSSAVAALAAPHGEIHTFTVLNGSTLANGDAESAARTADALGMPNHQLCFDVGRIPAVEEYKRLLWLLETPLCGPEQYYKYELYRFVKHTRPELRGMLLGQASDEFNGGYSVALSGGTGWDGFMRVVDGLVHARALQHSPGLAAWWSYHDRPLVDRAILEAPGEPGLLADPYTAFVAWKYRDIQQYNCWHEDRTAAGNGVEARVPFLDHRIVELMATVPVARRARLLWDKWVLREAVRDLVPLAVSTRPKVSFYHGDGAEFTHRAFVRMLAQDGAALVEESLAAPTARELVDGEAVRDMLASLVASRTPGGVEFLLRLVNLGLLETMTRTLPAPPVSSPRRELPPPSPITDWEHDRDRVAALMRTPDEEPALDRVIEFGDGVLLVSARAEPGIAYVAVDGQFEYVVDAAEDAAWFGLLRLVGEGRTLAELLAVAGASLDEVAANLRASLDAGVLVSRVPAPRSGEVESGALVP